MNDYDKEQLLIRIEELKDDITASIIIAKKRLKKGQIFESYEMLSDAIKAIEDVREQFP